MTEDSGPEQPEKELSEETSATIRYPFNFVGRGAGVLRGTITIEGTASDVAWRRFLNDVVLKPGSGVYPNAGPSVSFGGDESMTFAEFHKAIGGASFEDIPPVTGGADLSGTNL